MSILIGFLAKLVTVGFITGVVRVVMVFLGVGAVSVIGMDFLLGWASEKIQATMGALPSGIASLAGIAGVDYGINMILSAYSVRVALMTLSKFRLFT